MDEQEVECPSCGTLYYYNDEHVCDVEEGDN
jgi:hypothetical protein